MDPLLPNEIWIIICKMLDERRILYERVFNRLKNMYDTAHDDLKDAIHEENLCSVLDNKYCDHCTGECQFCGDQLFKTKLISLIKNDDDDDDDDDDEIFICHECVKTIRTTVANDSITFCENLLEGCQLCNFTNDLYKITIPSTTNCNYICKTCLEKYILVNY